MTLGNDIARSASVSHLKAFLDTLQRDGTELFDLPGGLASPASPLVVVAHPDDEIIGLGAQLVRWRGARFVHVTDGAPRDMRDAKALGFHSRSAYASARQSELRTALHLAGFDVKSDVQLGFVDKEATFNLVSLTRVLYRTFSKRKTKIVITHPYEGGHPDHDATAFAVHCAKRLIQANYGFSPIVVETTSYHNRAGIMQTGEFLPCPGRAICTRWLTMQERRRKARMLACFTTQERVLEQFQLDYERFREAPDYNFERPPHEGVLFYEQYGFGMEGRRWRELATHALSDLGLCA